MCVCVCVCLSHFFRCGCKISIRTSVCIMSNWEVRLILSVCLRVNDRVAAVGCRGVGVLHCGGVGVECVC